MVGTKWGLRQGGLAPGAIITLRGGLSVMIAPS